MAILLSLSTAAFGSDYKIDSNHAHARFEIDHFGTTTNKGGFYGLAGNVQFNLKAKTGFISVTIPVRNLVTGTPEFDKHLKMLISLTLISFLKFAFNQQNGISKTTRLAK